eukprot:16427287-Heterocapsa_arctica.AAC.1
MAQSGTQALGYGTQGVATKKLVITDCDASWHIAPVLIIYHEQRVNHLTPGKAAIIFDVGEVSRKAESTNQGRSRPHFVQESGKVLTAMVKTR